MEKIRYIQRNCTDHKKIDCFLNEARIGIVGISGDHYPYCVPVNYVWQNGKIYFHGMGSGKKNNLLMEHSNVSFTVFKEYGTVEDEVPCHADTSYLSVMIFGKAVPIDDPAEKAMALQAIIDKFMPGFYKGKISGSYVKNYHSSLDQRPVAVYQIIPEEITAKENAADPGRIH